jgi:hypothetical protein
LRVLILHHPRKPDKKLKEELIKIANKQRELLLRVVDNNQTKQSDNEKLNQLYEDDTPRLCQILTSLRLGPPPRSVDREGLFAAFYILKNGSYELQRDLLPVIVAAMKKDPVQKPDFAALIDRLASAPAMKQLFGTQAVSTGGFLVLYPVEDQANLNARRAEFGLSEMDAQIRNLETTSVSPSSRHASRPPAICQNN